MAKTAGIFSFFAGSGLLDLGFEHEGFQTLFVNENFPPFLHAYNSTRGDIDSAYGQSLENIESFADKINWLSERVADARNQNYSVGFIGGPPCPDFSVGGKNRGSKGENGKLSRTYSEIILACEPDWFLFENVKGLWRTKKHRAFFDELKGHLETKFAVTTSMVNAIEAGVPQDRDRIFMFGKLRNMEDELKNFRLSDNLLYKSPEIFTEYQWPTHQSFQEASNRKMPEGIIRELTVEHWFRKNNVSDHPNQTHRFNPRAGLKRFQSVDEGDDSRKSFKRLHRWRYSPTAAYGNNEVHLHPYNPRRISVAEALSIQSMPTSFHLPGDMTLTNMFKTIGNGVPYLLARHVARKIKLRVL